MPLRIGNVLLWRRLNRRFGVMTSEMSEAGVKYLGDGVIPVIEVSDVQSDHYIETANLNLTAAAGAFVAIASAPAGFKLRVFAFSVAATSAATAAAIADVAGVFVRLETDGSGGRGLSIGGGVETPEQGQVGFLSTGNAADSARECRVAYSVFPCQQEERAATP